MQDISEKHEAVDLSQLKIAIHEVLNENRKMDLEDHLCHHAWIKEHIQAQIERQEFYKEVRRIVMQWSIPAICGAIIYFVLHGKWPVHYF